MEEQEFDMAAFEAEDRVLRAKHVSEVLTLLVKEVAAREYSSRFCLRKGWVFNGKYVCYQLNRVCPQCKRHHTKRTHVKAFLSASGYTPLANRDCVTYDLSFACMQADGSPYARASIGKHHQLGTARRVEGGWELMPASATAVPGAGID